MDAPPAIPAIDRRFAVTVAAALAAASGLLSIALAAVLSRQGSGAAYPIFWVGLLLIYVPVAIAAMRDGATPSERLLLILLLGLALYGVKVVGWPDSFSFTDEFVHLRNTQDILRTGHLFELNPLLPTAAFYPGLAALTAGLADLSGMSPFWSGLLIIGLARALVSVAFFYVARHVTGSSRAASAASLLYSANPMFLLWGAAFAYENLALPLAAFVVWWIAQTRSQSGAGARLVIVIAILGVIVTHHVVGFALAAVLVGWWFVEHVDHERTVDPDAHRLVGWMGLVAGASAVAWLGLVARPGIAYLITENLIPAMQQVIDALGGRVALRHLYESGGFASPLWEKVVGVGGIAVLLLALPFALKRAWSRPLRAPLIVASGIALIYPVSLLLRLTPNGVGISGRSSEYVFFGLACVVGLLVAIPDREIPLSVRRFRLRAIDRRYQSLAAASFLTLVFVGSVTVGTAFYQRLPEASKPAGYPWALQQDVIDASLWTRANLGRDQAFGANAIDALALATYGDQRTLTQNDVWSIFFAESLDDRVVERIKSTGVRYLLLDMRMADGVPATPGYYFSPQEPHAGEYSDTFPRAALLKFLSSPCITSVYDAGAIKIVDVSSIDNGACPPVAFTSAVGSFER